MERKIITTGSKNVEDTVSFSENDDSADDDSVDDLNEFDLLH